MYQHAICLHTTQIMDDVPTLVLKRDIVEKVVVSNAGLAPILMSVMGDGKHLPLWLEVRGHGFACSRYR